MTLDFTITHTPVGPIGLYGLEDRLVGLTLDGEHGADHPVERHLAHHLGAVTTRPAPDAAGAASRLARYFGGELEVLAEQPVRLLGTEFQCGVWSALREIPAGETVSYTELARRIGAPKSVRAVAQACGANRIAVAIPCHRVVRNDGALSGYRWGVARKRALLEKESRA